MDKFIEIKNNEQLNKFLEDIWDFHDSVISKINYISGSSGSREGTCPFDYKKILVIRFESVRYEDKIVDALELKFEKLEKAFIAPNEDNYTTNIMGAKIVFKDEKFIFVNDVSLDINKIFTDERFYYYVSAEKLYYRFIVSQSEEK